MDDWGWEQLRAWLEHRTQMPIGALFCVSWTEPRGKRSATTVDYGRGKLTIPPESLREAERGL